MVGNSCEKFPNLFWGFLFEVYEKINKFKKPPEKLTLNLVGSDEFFLGGSASWKVRTVSIWEFCL